MARATMADKRQRGEDRKAKKAARAVQIDINKRRKKLLSRAVISRRQEPKGKKPNIMTQAGCKPASTPRGGVGRSTRYYLSTTLQEDTEVKNILKMSSKKSGKTIMRCSVPHIQRPTLNVMHPFAFAHAYLRQVRMGRKPNGRLLIFKTR